jgi:hypothetical protein
VPAPAGWSPAPERWPDTSRGSERPGARPAASVSTTAIRQLTAQPGGHRPRAHDHEQGPLIRDPTSRIPGAEWPIRGAAWTAKDERDGVPNGGSARVLLEPPRSLSVMPLIGIARLSITGSIRRDRLWHAGSPRVRGARARGPGWQESVLRFSRSLIRSLIRLSSRASAVTRQLRLFQVTDVPGRSRTLRRTLGKRVGGNPSGVRISYPPPPLTRQYARLVMFSCLARQTAQSHS